MESFASALPLRSQRKRKRVSYSAEGITTSPQDNAAQEKLLALARTAQKLVVFSGSGLSAGSGMSTFSTKGGLYERAQKRFAVADGKRLFTYSFYEKRKLETLAFFADIYAEARKAKPGAGHKALAQIAKADKLLRHYTMNIDGLAETAGMDAWHVESNPTGQTVEMHGNISQLVCPSCGVVVMMTPALLKKLKGKKAIACGKCSCQAMRCRIMLYDDAEDDVITPEDVFDVMEEDVQKADLILWVGISFEQSASTAYFRRVRQYLMEARRLEVTRQAIINITEEALWNLMSACSNTGSLDVLEVLSSSDTFLPVLAAAMADSPASAQADSNDASQQQAEQQPQGHSSTEPAHQQQSQQVSQGSSVLNTAAAQQPQQNSVQKVEGAVMLQNAVALQPQQQNQHGKKLPKQRQQAAEQQQPASWQPQHHMQTRRQLGHQVAQLQQLGNCQQPQQQQLQARLDRQRTPQQWQQQHQDLAQSQQNNQLPRLQQSDQVQDGEPAADHQLQQQSAQGQQSCPDQRPQQQRPHGHQLQDKQQHQQRMHEKQPPHQQHQLQDQQSLIGQEQEAADQQPQVSEQQASNQQQQAADQQQVQQHQRGTLAARPVLHPQAAVRLAAEEASSSQQHQQAQDARRKQGALTMPEHQALIVAVQSLDPGQEKDIQQQQPLPLQLEPSEAELRVPEPVSQRRQPASGAGLQSSQQTAAQTLTLQQQLGVHTVMPSSEALAREDIRPSPDPEIQVLSEGQGQTLRLVEGQLPANLEQCQTD